MTNARLGLWLGGSLLLHALVVQFVDVRSVSMRPPMGSLQVTLLSTNSHDGGAKGATVDSTPLPIAPIQEQPSKVGAPASPVISEEPPKTAKVVAVAAPVKVLPTVDKPVIALDADRASENLAAKQPDKVRPRVEAAQRNATIATQTTTKPAVVKADPVVAKAKPAAVESRSVAHGRSAAAQVAKQSSAATTLRKNDELVEANKPAHTAEQSTSTLLASVSTQPNTEQSSSAARIDGHESATQAAAERGAERSAQDSMDASGHAAFLQLLHAAIDGHKRYPRMARRMRREGVATVLFRIHPDGDLDALTLADSSGFAALDEAALRAVAAVAPFAPAAKFLTRETRFRVGVKFHLY